MPYYSVIVRERGKGNKSQVLPDPIFAPCVSDAWVDADKIKLPKKIVIIDIVPQEERKRYAGF